MTLIESVLQRSNKLDEAISALLDAAMFSDLPRSVGTLTMCDIALEHADSLRILITTGNLTSAVSLIRLQYEALVRAIWLLYSASDLTIAKLQAPLNEESEKAASNLPGISEMLKRISTSAPAAASQMLAEFDSISRKAINSYVHGGIHAVKRHGEGYPEPLVIQVLQSSNALLTMTGMLLAILSGDTRITKPMSKIQHAFKDCLPPLLEQGIG